MDILHEEFKKAGIRSVRIGVGGDGKNDFKSDYRYKNFLELQSKGFKEGA